jgi:hypothetical protein
MTLSRLIAVNLATAAALSISDLSIAAPEKNCLPQGMTLPQVSPADEDAYQRAVGRWRPWIEHRYLEGEGCTGPLFGVRNYRTFPVYDCTYDVPATIAGDSTLHGRVLLLEPSSEQLALWTVHACRINGADTPERMERCLTAVAGVPKAPDAPLGVIINSNGAQFPVSGIVIEDCKSAMSDAQCISTGRDPETLLNVPFRDGVTIETADTDHWSEKKLSLGKLEELIDLEDDDVGRVYRYSRISSLSPDDWNNWQAAGGNAFTIPLDEKLRPVWDSRFAWLGLSREVHKDACAGAANDFLDALVSLRDFAK